MFCSFGFLKQELKSEVHEMKFTKLCWFLRESIRPQQRTVANSNHTVIFFTQLHHPIQSPKLSWIAPPPLQSSAAKTSASRGGIEFVWQIAAVSLHMHLQRVLQNIVHHSAKG
mmetsp:Transcript_45707/g.138894  ORF Transcript_45707/g.138894 Transcript_45707/m.138894 type:complete len:113 (+) Transcript_45707:4924-5262(+)